MLRLCFIVASMPIAPGKLSHKIIGILLAMLIVAVAATGLTLFLSRQLEGVAAAINDAGSQRMRSYRIAHLMSRSAAPAAVDAEIDVEIARFGKVLRDLSDGDPERPLASPRSDEVRARLQAVGDAWSTTMRPMALDFRNAVAGERPEIAARFYGRVEAFVGEIDALVLAMERSYTRDTNLLRSVQAGLVLLAVLGTVVLVSTLVRLVIRPVASLEAGMRRMSGNDLDVRLPVESDDEFGQLAQGFNRMADHLQGIYSTLEERVAQETQNLAERNRELGILYGVTAFLGEPASLETLCQGFLERICEALGAGAAAVRLRAAGSDALHALAERGTWGDSGAVTAAEFIAGHAHDVSVGLFSFDITHERQRLGVFDLYFRQPPAWSERERQLLETLGRHLGVAIENLRLKSREQELAVSEERNLLAQELHDSIAQGLAFLNIQVQLLADSLQRGQAEEAMQTAGQLREGVQESYDDVRELLVHFRTRLNQADLESAIATALQKFEGQTGIQTEFEHSGDAMPLAPTDELQIMHIVQESLSNVRKHARASRVHVSLRRSPGGGELVVTDDGQGFDPDDPARNVSGRHVGLEIMRERAHRIGGECRILSQPGAGTRVVLVLPGTSREIH